MLRIAIRAGGFDVTSPGSAVAPAGAQPLTLDDAPERFVKHYSRAAVPGRRRTGASGTKSSWRDDEVMLRIVCAHSYAGTRLGLLAVTDLTEHHVEVFLQGLAAAGRAPSTRNHYLRLLKLIGRWMVRQGYRPTPLIAADSELRQDRDWGAHRVSEDRVARHVSSRRHHGVALP